MNKNILISWFGKIRGEAAISAAITGEGFEDFASELREVTFPEFADAKSAAENAFWDLAEESKP